MNKVFVILGFCFLSLVCKADDITDYCLENEPYEFTECTHEQTKWGRELSSVYSLYGEAYGWEIVKKAYAECLSKGKSKFSQYLCLKEDFMKRIKDKT